MDSSVSKIMELARTETLPEVPVKIRWKARIFGKPIIKTYYQEYYERESVRRVPFYLPYLFMQEHFDYLRRYGKIPRHQISMVLIDGMDERIDYFLYEFLEKLNYLTIVTERKEYFEGLQERAFQELGLLIDLERPWKRRIFGATWYGILHHSYSVETAIRKEASVLCLIKKNGKSESSFRSVRI